MQTVENDLRQALRVHEPQGQVPVEAALRAGRRARLARRLPAAASVIALAIFTTVVVTGEGESEYRLVGSGLTLASGAGVAQISGDRVDMGDGIEVWRDGDTLAVGEPAGTFAFIDTTAMTSRWGDGDYDVVVLDDAGEQDGSTMVIGTIKGEPRAVTVSIGATAQEATVACFEQAPGWCTYKAKVPASWRGPEEMPRVTLREGSPGRTEH